MSVKNYGYRFRRYAAASLILLAVIWLAMSVGQLATPADTTTAGSRFNLSSPAGTNLKTVAGVSQKAKNGTAPVGPIVRQAEKSDTSASLRSIPMLSPQKRHSHEENEANNQLPGRFSKGLIHDPVVQNSFGPLAMPTPIVSFDGMTNPNGYEPPDTNGDVGPNHYVQTVNASFQIWDKSGNSLYGPADINTLWQGFGGLCESTNDGDPIVLYDPLADRWLITQFAFADANSPIPSHQCFAISTTPDSTGSYHRYDFLTAGQNHDLFGDYPHLGVWPDGYYMTTNEFSSDITGFQFAGAGNFAFERTKMLTGDPTAQMIYFDLATQEDGGMLPSDMDGAPPPAGSPNYFIEPFNDAAGVLHMFKFHADWANPANSTFAGPSIINVAPWSFSLCPAPRGACIDQPGSFMKLEGLNDRLMNRLAYRNMGNYESLLLNNTANADGNGLAGIRWYEIRNPNGTPLVFQQSTYSPSADHRWMGSLAMDHVGNIALGYSVSNATDIYPSIRYAGKLVNDPLNTLAQGEGTIIAGGGSQGNADRWGDYSSMSVDPVDDCTFWFTTEYYSTTPIFFDQWQTRIGSFKFPSCTQSSPTPTVTGTPPTNTPTFTPSNTSTITPTPCGGGNYTISQSTGAAIVPGTDLVGDSQGDDVIVNIPLPFAFNLYGQAFNSVHASSNGNLQFTSNSSDDYTNSCLPASALNNAILAHWDDLVTNNDGDGIYTSVSGNAPNRIFNIEWRACLYEFFACGGEVNFEVRLYEGQSRFDIVYGTITNGGESATVGVQRGTGTNYTQFECDQADSLQSGLRLTFALPTCASTTPTNTTAPLTNTPTRTRTNTPPALTNTPTSMRTNTPVAAANLVGHVTWQGRPAQPNALQQLPITLTLKMGAMEMNYTATATDASGFFVVQVNGLPNGTYNWRVKGPKYLANVGTVSLTGAPTTSTEMGLLRTGDCNNDNLTSVLDFSILKTSFGKGIGDPTYDDRADFTGDHQVSVLDFNLLKINFGSGGAPPLVP